jgi:transposase InsO family protein
MGLPRSTYYDAPPVKVDYAEMVTAITAICDEFEAYGYRRVGAELRHQGMVVNSKKIRRLMRKHDLQPKRRRRFVATTDSDHGGHFPYLARLPSEQGSRRRDASTTSDHGSQYASEPYRHCSRNMVSQVRWADAAILMTMPRPKAS